MKMDFANKKIMKKPVKDKELRKIADELLKLKEQLKNTKRKYKISIFKKVS